MALTKAEIKSAFITWQNLDNRLNKSIESIKSTTKEIQKDVAKELASVKKQNAFCLFMEHQKTVDGKVCGRLQTCINKPTTQRYIFKVPTDKPLTQKLSIRTASKELLKYKKDGKAIVNQKQIDQKGVYHSFKWDIPAVKKPTQISATQKVVIDFDMTKVQYIANAEKIKFATVE
jgi:hypothetical protein|tara:strand:- start:110 stop:634 length:525 start_codon:yes stop_codon:yes gene_type:complete